MNEEQQASIAIKRFLGPLKVLLTLGDQFDNLGSIKQAIVESESRLEALRQKESKFFEDNEKAKAKATAELTRLRQHVAEALAEVKAVEAKISDLDRQHTEKTQHLRNVEKRLAELRGSI